MNSKEKKIPGPAQIGLHAVGNFLGKKKHAEEFKRQYAALCQEYGLEVLDDIEEFGFDLTDVQLRMMEGILRGFSETDYKGNLSPKNKDQLAKEEFRGKLSDSYKYIDEIPRIRASKSKILDWAGLRKDSIACVERAEKAIHELGTMMFCFYYDRLAKDDEGLPIKDKKGQWKKESVTAVSSLFIVKEVRDEKTNSFRYYEIEPSSIFLDQRESYFMLVPYNWREEVCSLVGKKKTSAYTFRFLMFLRYQYELKRRSAQGVVPHQLAWTPEEVAIAIKMPESVYRRKRDRMNKILEDAYSVAKKLGYLSDYQRGDGIDTLIFNAKKYQFTKKPIPELAIAEERETPDDRIEAVELFEVFHRHRRTFDQTHTKSVGEKMKSEVRIFSELLKLKSKAEIERVIRWGISRKYWCSRLVSPEGLKRNFEEAFAALIEFEKESSTPDLNKAKALLILRKITTKPPSLKIEALNKHVELVDSVHARCISYDSKSFEKELESMLIKWGCTLLQ